jgi:hypothetical protein
VWEDGSRKAPSYPMVSRFDEVLDNVLDEDELVGVPLGCLTAHVTMN